MIAYLQGTVLRKAARYLVVEVSGVGYAVFVPAPLYESVSAGDLVTLHIHTHVTENDIVLFGFAQPSDCTFFELLISVSGIGAKTALQILSFPIQTVCQAIVSGDLAVLTKVPGIGRKTAERLVIELKDKVDVFQGAVVTVQRSPLNDEALEALLALGFQRHEAMQLLAHVPAEITKPQDVVQYALKQR